MRKIFTFVFGIVCFHVLGQSVHLTQYLTSNQTLNPAYTGYYEGDYRITLNHRNQWRQLPSAIITNQLAVEKRIKRFDHEIGVGVMLINDEVKDLSLSTNQLLLSGAYQFQIKEHLFRFGLQGKGIYRQSDFGKQTFPSQWNYELGIFDDSFNNNEVNLQGNDFYMSFSAGVSWTKRYKKWKLNLGYGGFNLNQPKNGFANNSNSLRLPLRNIANFRVDYFLSERIIITPSILYMFTSKTKDLLSGIMGLIKLTTDFRVGLGISHRGEIASRDALIPTFLLGYKRFDIGFSNDYTLSGLNEGGRKSSYEISIIYTSPSATSSRATIPCERF